MLSDSRTVGKRLFPSRLITFALGSLVAYEIVGGWWNASVRSFTLIKEFASPSGKYKAVLFTQDCGTMCEIENDVSVLPVDQAADADRGRVYRSFGEYGMAALAETDGVASYPTWTKLRWLDDSRLAITYDPRAQVSEASSLTSVGYRFLPGSHEVHIVYAIRRDKS